MKLRIVAVAGVAALAASYMVHSHLIGRPHSAATTTVYAAQTIPLTISSAVPAELNPQGGGAPTATLQQAAAFAWQEFFALNWPAKESVRDTADTSKLFGDQSGPLVWQTYRSKVEIFPGNGYAGRGPHGYQKGAPDYGYDEPPQYVYQHPVPACSGQSPPAQPAWINLDEVSQIALDSMFAGVEPAKDSSGNNSEPKLIRFLAKANKTQYTYVVSNKYWYNSSTAPLHTAQVNFSSAINSTPPQAPKMPYVNFPSGTIEVKAAWRQLGPNEDPARFHMTTVRYYEKNNHVTCYREGPWALVALHIIQKTPTAPAFIFATFEQADNILLPGLDPAGKPVPVEDADGNIVKTPAPTTPTTPDLSYQDDKSNPMVSLNPLNSAYCASPGAQIYYKNTAGLTGLPTGGSICVNQRDNPIPSDVIAVNKEAHDAIRAYNSAHNITQSPWLFYKLVDVQAYPFDKSHVDPTNPNGMHNPATFFQANIVVETNYTLQMFHGRFGSTNGAPTDFPAKPPSPPPPNVFVFGGTPPKVSSYNMGGCMGCHGNAQVAGSDFSFILNQGPVGFPEPPKSDPAMLRKKYMQQFGPRR
jgi:hypothetical protein